MKYRFPRICGHFEFLETSYSPGSKNWKKWDGIESRKMCKACYREKMREEETKVSPVYQALFPDPPSWDGTPNQVDFAGRSWKQAHVRLLLLKPAHPEFPLVLQIAREVSGRTLSVKPWLDAWTEIMPYWPWMPCLGRSSKEFLPMETFFQIAISEEFVVRALDELRKIGRLGTPIPCDSPIANLPPTQGQAPFTTPRE